MNKLRRRLCSPFLPAIALFAISVALTAPICAAPDRHDPRPTTYELKSTAPNREVEVAFQLRWGVITFPAVIGSKHVECVLDLGSSCVAWPSSLHLAGQPSHEQGHDVDAAGSSFPERGVTLPSITIGGYTVHGLRGFEVTPREKTPDAGGDPSPDVVLMGDGAFAQVILTIDYQRRVLEIRDPSYDFTEEMGQPQGRVFPIIWMNRDPRTSVGIPVLTGELSGRPARIVIDTGWGGFDAGIVDRSKATGAPIGLVPPGGCDGPFWVMGPRTQTHAAGSASIGLGSPGSVYFTLPAENIPDPHFPFDAVFGTEILRSFRVTIDFPRKKLLLARYDPTVVDPAGRGAVTVNNVTYLVPRPGPTGQGSASEDGIVLSKEGSLISSPEGTITLLPSS